jgi:hypothetical protein
MSMLNYLRKIGNLSLVFLDKQDVNVVFFSFRDIQMHYNIEKVSIINYHRSTCTYGIFYSLLMLHTCNVSSANDSRVLQKENLMLYIQLICLNY